MNGKRLAAALVALLLAGCMTTPPEPKPAPPPLPEAQAPEPPPPPREEPEYEARIEPRVVAPPVETPVKRRPDDVYRLLSYFGQVRKLPSPDLGREGESVRAAFDRSRSDFDRMRLAMLLSVPNTAITDEQRAADLLDPLVKNQNANLHGLALLVSAHLQERQRLGNDVQHLQQNVQGLQQKLDALMSLERSLVDRDKPAPPARKR